MYGIAVMFAGLCYGSSARDVVRLPVPYMQQPDGSTCLPTSLNMAMHFLGRAELTTESVLKLHKTCRYDRYNVPALAQQFGLYAFPSWLEHAWMRETVESELRNGRPVVLGLDNSRAGHFVLAVGYTDDGRVIIHDPYWKEPGWYFGGPYVTTDWARLMWRNGIMLRGEPFPEPPRRISGNMVATTAPRTLIHGQLSYAEFAIKNNGREPWPDGVQLAAVDAYTSPPKERESAFAIPPSQGNTDTGTWLSSSRVAEPDKKNLPVGEIAYFKVPLRAPATTDSRTIVYRENFNLVDAQGVLFSDHYQTGPSNRQLSFRVAVAAPKPSGFKLPLVETVANGKPALPWKIKLGGPEVLTVASGAPVLPDTPERISKPEIKQGRSSGGTTDKAPDSDASTTGTATASRTAESSSSVATAIDTTSPVDLALPPRDTKILRLAPAPGQEFESIYVGDPLGTDYRVEAWVYCDYRPAEKDRGFDRYGIFIRDSGHHRPAPKTETENSEHLLMVYDTDNGRLRTGNFANGGIGDTGRRSPQIFIKESGWHRFAIRAEGTTVTYELDGREIARTSVGKPWGEDPDEDAPFKVGDCGVFVRACWADEADRRRGLLFAGFRVDP